MKTNIVSVGNIKFGGKKIILIAGPCSIDSEESLLETAIKVKKVGATVLRGDAFKPRTDPDSFQGLGLEGLKILNNVRKKISIPIITEIIDSKDINIITKHCDIIKIGTRNMQNFSLLKEVGRINKPVILKRGFGNTIKELLSAAKYIEKEGNNSIILCERGIRTFETSTRFTFDVTAIPKIKELCNFPVIADPSHATGQKNLVEPISLAAIAAGADGLLIEVHTDPEKSLSDSAQTISTKDFERLVRKIKAVAHALGREL
jgi:3-deoxy-7-phosphoheptulonate synthase